ncbi:V-set and transmembrane domain-containing protein 1 isoform X3 [Delphinapterus leucas]|uniref:V-set and transmembrane domain-containing protein 1 isoform X3 n=1 Tax=Delphinapterus leucas TaxID=9749 RepID=A0A2Y9PGL5_DELLE|nr:V-set and transmembrane domain-containing protein 1 isoform X3 [Delphinapterus leucas]
MITEFLSLLHLGLCLGNEDEKDYDEDEESGPDPAKTEPAIPNFPSRELQVYPNWKDYLNRHRAWLVATVFGISALHARLFSSKPEESQGVTYVKLNTNALSEAASVPTKEPAGSCDYATLKV